MGKGECLRPEEIGELFADRLSATEVDRVESHLDSCDACRQLIGELAAASVPAGPAVGTERLGTEHASATVDEKTPVPEAAQARGPATGDMIGRYRVIRRLGAGGMGLVLLAEDVDLKRQVALKLVLPDRALRATDYQRTMREAQAMAKVSHPNVVAIFDVGTHRDRIYIAMELVAGRELSSWLGRDRSVDEILRVFREAAQGLDAAHRAGLVHRDFKPHNVMVGDDGVVKVMDFGLARAATTVDESSTPDARDEILPGFLATPITRAGALVGTPAYMAPEQLRGDVVDARSDQYSFCVTLYEALYRKRPYVGVDGRSLHEAMRAGPPSLDPGRGVPRRVREALRRGLAFDTADRWPSMGALVAALDAGRPRRVMVGAAIAAVVASGGVIAVYAATRDRGGATCAGGDAELAVVWNKQRANDLERAFATTKLPMATPAARAAIAELDRFAAAWRAEYLAACEATRVRGTQTDQQLALRMQCLRSRRGQLAAALDVLASPSENVLVNARSIVGTVPSPATCSDPTALEASAMPADPYVQRDAALIEVELARGAAQLAAQQHVVARTLTQSALERAQRLAYKPLLARAEHQLGQLELNWGDATAANTHLTRAGELAEEMGDHELRALALNGLGQMSLKQGKLEDALRWSRYAEAALKRLDPQHPRLATVELDRAGVLAAQGDSTGAEAAFQHSIERSSKASGPTSDEVANARTLLAVFYVKQSNPARAIEELHRARAIWTERNGPRSIEVANTLDLEGHALAAQGRGDEALAAAKNGLDIMRDFYGEEHELVGTGYATIALALSQQGRHDEAIEYMKRSVAIGERLRGAADPIFAGKIGLLAYLYVNASRLDEGYAGFERANAIATEAYGGVHEELVIYANAMASVRQKQKRYDDALALLARSRSIVDKLQQPRSANLAEVLSRTASVHVDRDKPAEAIPLLDEALAIQAERGVAAGDVAWTRFHLARALWSEPAQRARSRELFQRAATDAAEAGDAELVRRIDTWRTEHHVQ